MKEPLYDLINRAAVKANEHKEFNKDERNMMLELEGIFVDEDIHSIDKLKHIIKSADKGE